jgi:hypothetical protein
MVGAALAVSPVVLHVVFAPIKGNQDMLPGDLHQYVLRYCAVKIAAFYKHRLTSEGDFRAARHDYPGFGCGEPRGTPFCSACLSRLYVSEIFTAGVAKETGGIVRAPASGAGNFTFGSVLADGGKRQPALVADFFIRLVPGAARRTQYLRSFSQFLHSEVFEQCK